MRLAPFISREHFETMKRGLVAAARIRRRGDRYFPARGAPALR